MSGIEPVDLADWVDFDPPAGLRVRGTLLVVPGRGESVDTYGRFGRRIASDSYRVRVLAAGTAAESPAGHPLRRGLTELASALAEAVADLGEEVIRPLVLVGSDLGAAELAALVGRSDEDAPWWPDALVLAAIPGYGAHDSGGDWESELDIRTHCPVHRAVLTEDASVQHGDLVFAIEDGLLEEAYGSAAALPQLLLVGDSDPLADHAALVRLADSLTNARLSVVRGAHHDVLNDLQHRTVAAEVVTFLEALRTGSPIRALIAVPVSSW